MKVALLLPPLRCMEGESMSDKNPARFCSPRDHSCPLPPPGSRQAGNDTLTTTLTDERAVLETCNPLESSECPRPNLPPHLRHCHCYSCYPPPYPTQGSLPNATPRCRESCVDSDPGCTGRRPDRRLSLLKRLLTSPNRTQNTLSTGRFKKPSHVTC